MELSSEDALRLNVLLASAPLAIRIDESRMVVHGLTPKGEAQVRLNPSGRDEAYVKKVKELLSGHVLGSPGGYPVYLQRWTRMGQMRDQSLEQLLLLGEPEAVVAAVCSPGLTDELARRAWWAMEDAENARRMLACPAVLQAQMGPVLANYLVEHLPFETEPEKMMESIELVLTPGLLTDAVRDDLWKKAQRKNAYYVGFLAALPDDLPMPVPAHPALGRHGAMLEARAGQGDALAGLLQRCLSGAGQAYLETVLRVLNKPANQDVVNRLLDVVADYFAAARPELRPDQTLDELVAEAESWLTVSAVAASGLLQAAPELRGALRALRVLSGLGYGVVRPVFRDSTAIGSLMRRKLAPVLDPVLAQVERLRGKGRR